MPYFVIAMIIGITAFLIIRAVKKKSVPQNNSTSDGIELDRSFDSKLDEPESDTTHLIRPEAKQDDEHEKRF